MMEICLPLHARRSPLPVCCQGAAPAPLLGTSVGGQSLGKPLWGPGPPALLLRLPVTFLRVNRRHTAENNMLKM